MASERMVPPPPPLRVSSERGSQLIAYVLDLELQLLDPAAPLMELLPQRSDLFLLLIKHIQQLKHTANAQNLTLSPVGSELRSVITDSNSTSLSAAGGVYTTDSHHRTPQRGSLQLFH